MLSCLVTYTSSRPSFSTFLKNLAITLSPSSLEDAHVEDVVFGLSSVFVVDGSVVDAVILGLFVVKSVLKTALKC